MNGSQPRKLIGFCFFCLVFFLSLSPFTYAQREVSPEERGGEDSASQAQSTMASLFGRGAKMPGIPRVNGTIALPAFDSSGMTIDEGVLEAAQREAHVSGNGQRSSKNASVQR